MTNFLNTLNLNSKIEQFYVHKFFHSSVILNSENKDIDLIKRFERLYTDDKASSNSDNIDSLIELRIKNLKIEEKDIFNDSQITEFDAEKLRDFSSFNEFINLSKINKNDSNQDYNNFSTFLDAFPNYDPIQQALISTILKKIYDFDMNSLINIINTKGLREGMTYILQNYRMFTFMSVKEEGEEITGENIEKINADIKNLTNKFSELEARAEESENKFDKVYYLYDETSNVLNRTFELYNKGHLTNASLWVKGILDIATVVTPFFAYKLLLKAYTNHIDPVQNKSHLSAKEIEYLMQKRTKNINRFNYIVLPFIGALSVYKAMHVSKIDLGLNVKIEVEYSKNENLSTSASFILLGLKNILGKYFYISIPIIIILSKYIFLPYIKVQYPLFYENMVIIVSNNIQYLPALLILWFFIVCFINFIELYIYLKYYISNEELYLPKLLPNFTKNWLTNLYKISKSDNKNDYLFFLSKLLFLSLLVTLVTLTLIYIFI